MLTAKHLQIVKEITLLNNSGDEEFTVYIGDGNSDKYSTQFCDFIFAKDDLLKYCEKERITFFPFNNFEDVITRLELFKIKKTIKEKISSRIKKKRNLFTRVVCLQSASKIFKYRSYTPIPFLLIMFFYANPNIWSILIGLLIALTGEAIRIWGVSWAGSETRTTGNVGGSFLVISGPFAHVRNPLYVGNILMYTGLGIMSFALFPYLQILGLIFFYFQYRLIVQEEELYLRKNIR